MQEGEEELAELERIQALLDLSEDEYEKLDPQQQEDIDRIRHNRSKEKRKESV